MRGWFRGIEVIELATVIFVLAYYYIVAFRLKQMISPDMVAIGVLVAFLIRSRGLLKDWIAFFGLFIIYELLRNLIPDINTRVDFTLVDGLEKAIFFGTYPVLWIQQYQNEYLSWLFFTVYIAHYFTILFPAVYLAFRNRWQFRGYITCIIVTSYLGFIIFLLFPVAPPRLALPGTEWITAKVFLEANVLITGLNGNPYAAMPSLHFGLPWVAFLYLRRCSVVLGTMYGIITAIMAVGVIYLGDHYVLDVVGGVLVGLAGYHISKYLTGDFFRRPPPVRWLGKGPEAPARKPAARAAVPAVAATATAPVSGDATATTPESAPEPATVAPTVAAKSAPAATEDAPAPVPPTGGSTLATAPTTPGTGHPAAPESGARVREGTTGDGAAGRSVPAGPPPARDSAG